jgi:hypothetical protein
MSAQKILRGLGNIFRQTGQAIDTLGLKVQGKYGYKEGGECIRIGVSRTLLKQT